MGDERLADEAALLGARDQPGELGRRQVRVERRRRARRRCGRTPRCRPPCGSRDPPRCALIATAVDCLRAWNSSASSVQRTSAARTRCSGVQAGGMTSDRPRSVVSVPSRERSTRYSRRGRSTTANANGRSERPSSDCRGCACADTGIRCRAMATRLRPLSEAEAYARCYAGASDEVRMVKIPRRPRYQLEVSGEDLRAAFADRLDRREPELDPRPGCRRGQVRRRASPSPRRARRRGGRDGRVARRRGSGVKSHARVGHPGPPPGSTVTRESAPVGDGCVPNCDGERRPGRSGARPRDRLLRDQPRPGLGGGTRPLRQPSQ